MADPKPTAEEAPDLMLAFGVASVAGVCLLHLVDDLAQGLSEKDKQDRFPSKPRVVG